MFGLFSFQIIWITVLMLMFQNQAFLLQIQRDMSIQFRTEAVWSQYKVI